MRKDEGRRKEGGMTKDGRQHLERGGEERRGEGNAPLQVSHFRTCNFASSCPGLGMPGRRGALKESLALKQSPQTSAPDGVHFGVMVKAYLTKHGECVPVSLPQVPMRRQSLPRKLLPRQSPIKSRLPSLLVFSTNSRLRGSLVLSATVTTSTNSETSAVSPISATSATLATLAILYFKIIPF
jgi:hypothetical protein